MRYFITTPIYYVNDKPHIGHAYTTLAADVLSRFLRKQGEEVFFLTGTDEHGAKIAEIAEKLGKTPQEVCDKNSENFRQAWNNLDIRYDYFIRTTDPRHEKAVQKFVRQLKEKDLIYEKEYTGLYCVGCEKFLTEKDLVNGLCPDHQRKPDVVSEKNYFFKLNLPTVEKLIKDKKLKISPARAESEVLGLLRQPLDDFSISRQKARVNWGIDLPFDEKQVIYVWVDALINYISAVGYGDDEAQFEKWWTEAHVIHLMAKDILKFHAVYWPALLTSLDIKNPDEEFIHGFFTINGQKMSKTLGNFIDPNSLVEKFGSDVTRYLLLTQFPLSQDGDVKEENFVEKYNSDLAQGLGNLVARVLALGEQYGKEITPQSDQADLVASAEKDYQEKMRELRFNEAAAVVWNLIAFVDKYISEKKPWQKMDDEKEITAMLGFLVFVLGRIAMMLFPIMPQTSKKILQDLSLTEETTEKWTTQKVLLHKQAPLFPKRND